jgi:hypothetical protein
MGTGTVLKSYKVDDVYYNIALTCAHVVDTDLTCKVGVNQYKNWSEYDSASTYAARVYYADFETDMALVFFVTPKKLCTATISFGEKLYIGTKVFSFGLGDGTAVPRLNSGEVTGVNYRSKSLSERTFHRINVPTISGDSGSGSWLDYGLVGIRAFVIDKSGRPLDHVAFMMSIDLLKDMSKDVSGNLDWVWSNSDDDFSELSILLLTSPVMEKADPSEEEGYYYGNVPPPVDDDGYIPDAPPPPDDDC